MMNVSRMEDTQTAAEQVMTTGKTRFQ